MILASYEAEMETGKGMRLFGSRELVAPDMLVFGLSGIFWAEAKEKLCVSWHRNSGKWQTGIDTKYWHDYKQVSLETRLPVWIFFLHLISEPRPEDLASDPQCPRECPTGLYTGRLETLAKTGRPSKISKMIYWDVDSLKKLADVSEL